MQNALSRTVSTVSTSIVSAFIGATTVFAQGFGGDQPDINGTLGGDTDIRTVITSTLNYVLSFLALIAVIVLVIAGIRLIVSQGNEEERDKAKKTILYAVIGLLIVLFARVIVGFFTTTLPQNIS